MHDPVAEGRRTDQSALGIVDEKTVISARSVGFIFKIVLEGDEIIFQTIFKFGYRPFPALSLACIAICQ